MKSLLALVLISILVRFSGFFETVINWDESTFIIVAERVLQGELPYETLWDIKPPGVFFVFAGLMSVFGKSIWAIRLGGAVLIGITSFFLLRACEAHQTRRFSWIAAVSYLVLVSTFHSGQAVLSEHLAVLPMMVAFYFLSKGLIDGKWAFLIGTMIGSMGLIRSNLIFLALSLLIFGFWFWRHLFWKRFLMIFSGALFPFLVLGLAYYNRGEWEVFFNTLFKVPLVYTVSSDESSGTGLFELIFRDLILDQKFGAFGFLALIGIFVYRKSIGSQIEKTLKPLFWFSLVGVFVSIILSGQPHIQYYLQVIPFISILAAVGLSGLISWINLRSKIKSFISIAVIGVLLVPLGLKIFRDTVKRVELLKSGELYTGEAFEVSKFIINNGLNQGYGLFLHGHIGYYLTQTKIPTYIAHPSNIFQRHDSIRAAFGDSKDPELAVEEILSFDPDFIVNRSGWDSHRDRSYILYNLAKDRYRLCARIGKSRIYVRYGVPCNNQLI